MRRINKSVEPQSLRKFKQSATHNNDWMTIHLPQYKGVYNDCMVQCINDQKGLCGYTECVLRDSNRHIDHYIKRSIAPVATYAWQNMIAAVRDDRFGANRKDNRVRNINDYTNLYNPIMDALSGVFTYSADGTISPTDSSDIKAQYTIDVFNLNEPSLKEQRANQMKAVRDMRKGGMDDITIEESLSYNGFISAMEYELQNGR